MYSYLWAKSPAWPALHPEYKTFCKTFCKNILCWATKQQLCLGMRSIITADKKMSALVPGWAGCTFSGGQSHLRVEGVKGALPDAPPETILSGLEGEGGAGYPFFAKKSLFCS